MAQYDHNPPLNESDLLSDPLAQFQHWMADAVAAGLIEPAAMSLATVGPGERPSARMVLFKGFHEGGFCFYSNYASKKGQDLTIHPHAALTFWWDRLERQIRIEGSVEKLPQDISERYFHSRPRGSQLGAYTSNQSAVLADRAEFDERMAANEARFLDRDIPLPPNWGGYRVLPDRIEFWQGRRNRVHDRLVYCREAVGAWRIQRLEP